MEKKYSLNFIRKKFNELDIINIFTIGYIFIISFCLFYFSKGDIRGVNPDFSLYIEPVNDFAKSNCNFTECLQYFIPDKSATDVKWILNPFYSIFFLIPISIFNSDLLFLLQGIALTFFIFLLLKNLLEEFYLNILSQKIISSIILIGFLNYEFIKDTLTSGTMSICFLLILLVIKFRDKFLYATIILSLAAILRSNFIFMSLSFVFSLLIVKPKKYKSYLYISFISILVYSIYYKLIYFSYPGNVLTWLFKTGFNGSEVIDNFFLERLPPNTEISIWEPNISEVISLFIKDFSLLYGVIINYIFKIIQFLNYMHMGFFTDERGIWIQRLSNIINFGVIYLPSFYVLNFSAISILVFKNKILRKFEELIIFWTILYIILHSLILGEARYLIGYHFILITIFLRYLSLISKLFPKKEII